MLEKQVNLAMVEAEIDLLSTIFQLRLRFGLQFQPATSAKLKTSLARTSDPSQFPDRDGEAPPQHSAHLADQWGFY